MKLCWMNANFFFLAIGLDGGHGPHHQIVHMKLAILKIGI